MSDIAKLRAAFCDHFIKTGELDAGMMGRLEAFALSRRGLDPVDAAVARVQSKRRRVVPALRLRPRVLPVPPAAPRAPAIHVPRPPSAAFKRRNSIHAAEWEAFMQQVGQVPGVIKGPKFIGPRFPRGELGKRFSAWRKLQKWSNDDAARNVTGHAPAISAIVAAEVDTGVF